VSWGSGYYFMQFTHKKVRRAMRASSFVATNVKCSACISGGLFKGELPLESFRGSGGNRHPPGFCLLLEKSRSPKAFANEKFYHMH